MKEIKINSTKNYKVIIGKNSIEYISEFLNKNNFKKILIITDNNIAPLYLNNLMQIIDSDYTSTIILPNGEDAKTPDCFLKIQKLLLEKEFTKKDLIIAFGGGTIGDISGFVASTYLRGIAIIHIPTTLLSMVDSSIGGKNAINLSNIKNVLGTIYQPHLVISDYNFLKSLDEKEYRNGIAEIIKYGIINNSSFFDYLYNTQNLGLEKIIETSVTIKKKFVETDMQDLNTRNILNFGHTIGHAIEAISNYLIPHGEAISIGMVMMAKISKKLQVCNTDVVQNIESILLKYNLPIKTDIAPNLLFKPILHDKKCASDKILIILPVSIGKCIRFEIETVKFEKILVSI